MVDVADRGVIYELLQRPLSSPKRLSAKILYVQPEKIEGRVRRLGALQYERVEIRAFVTHDDDLTVKNRGLRLDSPRERVRKRLEPLHALRCLRGEEPSPALYGEDPAAALELQFVDPALPNRNGRLLHRPDRINPGQHCRATAE